MPNLEPVRREQRELEKVVERERKQLTRAALDAVERRGYCQPYVVAWRSLKEQPYRFKLSSWDSKRARDEQFEKLREILDKKDVAATLTVTNGAWTTDGRQYTAVITVTRLPQGKKMMVHPFQVIEGGIQWEPVEELENFEGGFLRYPQFS